MVVLGADSSGSLGFLPGFLSEFALYMRSQFGSDVV